MAEQSNNSKIAIVVAIITVIGSLIVAIINKWDFPSKSSTDTSKTNTIGETNLPAPPPDIEEIHDYHPIIENTQLIIDTNTEGSGCELESGFRIVTLISENEDGYVMQDVNGYRDTYNLDIEELSNVDRSWVNVVMVAGRRLKVKCALCGNGGFLELAYIEPLKSFK